MSAASNLDGSSGVSRRQLVLSLRGGADAAVTEREREFGSNLPGMEQQLRPKDARREKMAVEKVVDGWEKHISKRTGTAA